MIYDDVRGRFLEKDFIPPKMQIRSTTVLEERVPAACVRATRPPSENTVQ